MLFEEFQIGCLVHGNLWYMNEMSYSKYFCWMTPSIKFLLRKANGLEEDVVWRNSSQLFGAWLSLVSEWNDLNYWESSCYLTPLKFLLKRVYGLQKDVVWKISIWLFSTWPSLISEWNYLSNSESPFCLDTSHEAWVQLNVKFGRCILKSIKMSAIVAMLEIITKQV